MFLSFIITRLFLVYGVVGVKEDWRYWFDNGKSELEQALRTMPNTNTAKNIIVFIGDGMGVSTLTAARIYKGQIKDKSGEEERLSFERFPHVALSKTYNTNKQVPDSAGTATAYWCGFKANMGTLGVDINVQRKQCGASLNKTNTPPCLLAWAQQAGKSTGIVTTTRVTHATPGALYAKSAERDWECDEVMSSADKKLGCLDIARQLVEQSPGRTTNVIFGGGRQMLISDLNSTKFGPESAHNCRRQDRRNLADSWLKDKKKHRIRAEVVYTKEELEKLDTSRVNYVLGLFSNSHMSYDNERDTGPDGEPSLAQMVKSAIEVLRKNKNGFFLAVEGGRIDHAHHETKPRRALSETLALDEAVEVVQKMTSSEDTLVVVTADHSHVMTIQGYPERGADILGVPEKSKVDGLPYPTLQYTNGPVFNFTINGTEVHRLSLVETDTRDWDFQPPTAIPRQYETHGGEDVAIFAMGPWSHLFHGSHEQSYIAHVVAHAARIGPRSDCSDLDPAGACGSGAKLLIPSIFLILVTALHLLY